MQSSNLEAAIAARDEYKTGFEREAFSAGYDHAHGIACHNVPHVGEMVRPETLSCVRVEDVAHARELHETLCYEAEMNARCFSPWEYTAHKINSLDEFEAEAAWEAYDEGVALAIGHDLSGYTDSDYIAD